MCSGSGGRIQRKTGALHTLVVSPFRVCSDSGLGGGGVYIKNKHQEIMVRPEDHFRSHTAVFSKYFPSDATLSFDGL